MLASQHTRPSIWRRLSFSLPLILFCPSLLLALPIANDDRFSVAEDDALTISSGGILVEASFEPTASILTNPWQYLDRIENENGANHSYPIDGNSNLWNSTQFDTTTSTIGPWSSGSAPLQGGMIDGFPPGTPDVLFGLAAAGNGENLVTTYLYRQEFTLTGAQAVEAEWEFNYLVDDGAIVYFNGTEIFRTQTMPAGAVTTTTLCQNGDENTVASALVDLSGIIVSGTNTIAVEVHQTTLTSSDTGFQLDLAPVSTSVSGGFVYGDDAFNGTSHPNNAIGNIENTGGFTGGGLFVQVGGQLNNNPSTSGGWSRQFSLDSPATVTISFRYRLTFAEDYENDEYGEALFEVDGVRYGDDIENSLRRIRGNGNGGGEDDSGWQLVSFDIPLAAGDHTMVLGAFSSKSTANGEDTRTWFDDVEIGIPATGGGVLLNDTGDSPTAILQTGPAHGTLNLNEDGSFSYQPTSNYHGPDSFSYLARDPSGDSRNATVNLTITPVNDPPVAQADTFVGAENQTTTRSAPGVLTNDTDIDTDSLTAVLVNNVSNGTLQLNPDGSFEYIPDASFFGTDTFTYRADDGDLGSQPVLVTLEVAPINDAPIAVNDEYTTVENKPIKITVSSGVEQIVFASDFNDPNLPPEFSGAGTFASVQGYDGRGPSGNIFDGQFLRNSSTGNPATPTTLSLTNLPPHHTISLRFLLAIIDTWDGANDDLVVTLDGTEIFNQTFNSNGGQTFPYHAGSLIFRDEHAAYGDSSDNFRDGGYDMSRVPAFRDIPHASTTATISWFASGNNWDGGDDESWAIDNLEVSVSATPVESLVTAGTTWSYLDNGSDQGTTWRSTDFEDGSWSTGPAQLGYGDGDEATEVQFGGDDGNKHITTYFRHTFTLTDADTDQFGDLVLGFIRDDGGAVYLNGILIAIDNLDQNASSAAQANNNSGLTAENTWNEFEVPEGLLIEGLNILAVEIHQDSPSSSDISMDLYLRGKRVAGAGVLANDTDPEDDFLTAELLTNPQNGSLEINPDGTFLYTPNVNYEGSDSFTYRVTDGEFNSDPATVTLTMTAGASDFPVTDQDTYSTTEDTVLTIDSGSGILQNDNDPDSPTLFAFIETLPTSGNLFLNAEGGFIYTPSLNFSGTDSFTYRASDSVNLSQPETVLINVVTVNDSPTAAPNQYLIPPGQTLTNSLDNGVLANDTDPDSPTLTAVLISDTSSGTLNLAPNGSFVYTPNAGFAGQDSFTYQASDGLLTSAIVMVSIEVNEPPLANDDSFTTTEESLIIRTTEEGILANDEDLNSLTADLVTEPDNGTLSLSLDGSFIYLPDGNFHGTDSFTYRADDSFQQSDLATVTITVTAVNDDPNAKDDSYETNIDELLSVTANQGVLANDTDIDSTNLTAILLNDVTNGTLNLSSDGSFTYQPNAAFIGEDSFTYEATDGLENSGETTVTINVLPASNNIIINEIMFHPPNGIDLNEFIELTNIGTTTVSLNGWKFTNGINFTFPDVSIPGGGFLVIAADTDTFETTYGALPNVIGNWTGKLSNSGERIVLADAAGEEVEEVRYYDQGDWAIRQRINIGNEEGWDWSSAADAGGSSLELINPQLRNKQGQNWASSLGNTPTPSAQNSTALEDTAPLILNVEHFPHIPTSSEPIGIVAELKDENGDTISGILHYRVSAQNPGPFQTATMLDDGYNCDSEAGDGIYGFMLPPQPSGTVIEFYLASSDGTNTRTWPAPASNGQTANALLQVDDEINDSDHGFYRIIMSVSELNQWRGINRQSNAMMNATVILNDGSGPKIRYLSGIRVRGAGSRNHTPPPMRVALPRDNEWNDSTRLNLNTKYTYLQFLGMKLFQASDIRAADTSRVQVRINGGNIARGDDFDYGSMVHVQPLSSEFINDKFATDDGGNLYKKGRPAREFTWRNGDVGDYEADAWSKQTNSSENDWSDLDEMLRVMNNASGDPDYLSQVEAVVDVDQWMKWFAAMTILANGETNVSNGADDDYSMYRGANDPRFVFIPHDLDTILSIGDGSRNENPEHTLFDMIEDGDVLDPFIPFFTHPEIIDRYYAALRELLQTTFSKQEFDELLENNLTDWVPTAQIEQMRTFMDARRIFIESEITPIIGPPNALPLATSNGAFESPHGDLYLSEILAINNSVRNVDGTYPDAIELHNSGATSISLEGMSLSDDPSLPNRFVFPAGAEIPGGAYLVIWGGDTQPTPGFYSGFNLDGQGETLSLYNSSANGGTLVDAITFGIQARNYSIARTGPNDTSWELCQPTLGEPNQSISLGDPTTLRINEWLSQDQDVFDKEFVELYNPSAHPIALGALAISDEPINYPRKHIFTNLSFIAPGSFTILTPNGDSADPSSADQLPFKLSSSNEWISLRGSNSVVIDQVNFVNQLADLSRGRNPDGSSTYRDFVIPTPGYSNSAPLLNEQLLLQNLRISEIMYDPSGGSQFEFIELENTGSEPINLAGVRFTEGIRFDFPDMILQPREFVLLVQDRDAFETLYGAGLNIAGKYQGKLSNGGERLRLEISSINAGIHNFEFDDWYPAANGSGFSLDFTDTSLPLSAWSDKQNWAASLAINGTPGSGGTFSIRPFVSELLSLPDQLNVTPTITFGSLSPASVTFQWSSVDGPSPVIFSDPGEANTTLSFAAPGVYTVRLAASAFGLNYPQEMTITVYDSYSDWITRNFGSETPGQTGKEDDPDGDGISNLFEFALTMDPTIADSELFPVPAYDRGENALTVTFTRNFFDPTEFAQVVEVSSDLKNWEAGPSAVTESILTSQNNMQTLRAVDQTSASIARTRFMRFRIICLDGVISNEAPQILSISSAPALPTLTFTSQLGQRYQLEHSSDPKNGWLTLGDSLLATSEKSVLIDSTGTNERLRLYRVVRLSRN
ncbi:MAG: hypothetical protein ACJA1W_000909 [Akkermansiaceae bacterium]|jgi:hypothetical protein